MKIKHKQSLNSHGFVQVDYIKGQSKQLKKKRSQMINNKNYMPLSNNHKHNQYEYASNNMNNGQQIKYHNRQNIKQSPYRYLPSLPSQKRSNINQYGSQQYYSLPHTQYSNVSIYQKLRLNSNSKSSQYQNNYRQSNYNTEQSQQSNYNEYNQNYNPNINTRRKSNSITFSNNQFKNKQSEQNKQSKCIHRSKSPNFIKKSNKQTNYFIGEIQQKNQNNNNYQGEKYLFSKQKSQQLIKKHINDKLDRVCQKIQNLSKEKQTIKNHNNHNQRANNFNQRSRNNLNNNKQNNYYSVNVNNNTGNKIQWGGYNHNHNHHNKQYNHNNHNNPNKQYNSIKQSQYTNQCITNKQPTSKKSTKLSISQISYQTNSSYKKDQYQDNRIQQRLISPPKPSHEQFLQNRIIQLDKKLFNYNSKILRLQEQLLQQRQKLIKKEKQWLMRQNQLLNWIQSNQYQLQQQNQQIIQPHQSPKRMKSSKIMNIHNQSNIVIDQGDNNQTNYNNYVNNQQQLKYYKQLCSNLYQFANNVLTVSKLNSNWLNLMNRTLSQQLPGTAFRVKQQINRNSKLIKLIQSQSINKLNLINNSYNPNSILTTKNTTINNTKNQTPIQTPPISTNQSQVFLLQSYCPSVQQNKLLTSQNLPISQHYQISTKRTKQNIKNSRKSIFCISQSKSTTNKKGINSTHKKSNISKSRPKQPKQIQRKNSILSNNNYNQVNNNDQNQANNRNKSINKCLYQSRKTQYYCDEVFYDQNNTIQKQIQLYPNIQEINNNQIYYMLSLQAIAIQNFINPNQSNLNNQQIDINFMPQESSLLDS